MSQERAPEGDGLHPPNDEELDKAEEEIEEAKTALEASEHEREVSEDWEGFQVEGAPGRQPLDLTTSRYPRPAGGRRYPQDSP